MNEAQRACHDRMKAAGLPEVVIHNFIRLHALVAAGDSGQIPEDAIDSVPPIPSLETIRTNPKLADLGRKAIKRLVICKLNGGLGTSMGLQAAKSLLKIKGELTFNDLNARQVSHWTSRIGERVTFLNMTSFSTDTDVRSSLSRYSDLDLAFLVQNKHPKILASTLFPAGSQEDEQSWNPPGHGDLYPALVSTGLLSTLLSRGKRYLFVSNSDNTAAAPELSILGYIAENNIPFLMEVTTRTPEDSKGGHLALRKSDQRLVLRESAQAPAGPDGDPSPEFQDINRYKYFNTNNLWIDLEALKRVLDSHDGTVPLPLIRNPKPLDPRNSDSPAIYQLETAMGAAIELFAGARALNVPRSRFAPVKNTSDLLKVRSDAYHLDEDGLLRAVGIEGTGTYPLIKLDKKYYGMMDLFERRFPVIPSLRTAVSFEVRGNVRFASPLTVSNRCLVIDKRTDQTDPASFPDEVKSLNDQTLTIEDGGFRRGPM